MPPKERVVLKRRSTSDSAALKKRKLARRLNANLNKNTGTGSDFQFGFQHESQPPSLSESPAGSKEKETLETTNSIELEVEKEIQKEIQKEIEKETEKKVEDQSNEKMIAENETGLIQLETFSESTAVLQSDVLKEQNSCTLDQPTNLHDVGSIVASHIQLSNQDDSDKGTEVESDIDPGLNTVPHPRIEHPYRPQSHSQSPISNPSLPSSGQISNLFSKRSIHGLTELLRDVDNLLPKEFLEYRRISANKIRTSDTLINNLTKENKKLRDRIKDLKKENILNGRQSRDLVKKNEQKQAKLNQTIDNHRNVETDLLSEINDLKLKLETVSNKKKESEENERTKNEVLELLSGLSCIALIEDESKICFTVKQISSVGTLIYNIVISKEVVDELAYIPLWDKPDNFRGNWEENIQVIKKHLPDYLVGELTFPSDSLHAFYLKLTKSLNKKK